VLRAGSAGCVSDGRTYGECHRVAHLRARGVDKPVDADRDLMFQGGEGNEDLWRDVLVLGWEGPVLRKQRVQKQGSWGTVSGEPDIVLAHDTPVGPVWVIGLELKLVSAANSAVQRALEGEPDSKHLIQAACYMWLTGLPYVLCYTNRCDFALEFRRKQYGGLTKIPPFYRLFYLAFQDDRLWYRDEYSSEPVATRVTGEGLRAYYQQVHDMAFNFDLGSRPASDHVNGAEASWNKCDSRYCPFAGVCDNYERDYSTWFHAAAVVAKEG
jgi:hypothetical protein